MLVRPPVPVAWAQADTACTSINGRLVSINDADEYLLLYSTLVNVTMSNAVSSCGKGGGLCVGSGRARERKQELGVSLTLSVLGNLHKHNVISGVVPSGGSRRGHAL